MTTADPSRGQTKRAETAIRPGPFLRWMGGKRRASSAIIAAIDASQVRRYYEPFLGGGALFFALPPKQGVLSDTNADLMSAYEAVRSDPTKIHNDLAAMPSDRDSYYRYREQSANISDPYKRALHFVYLNRWCFNGLYRTNRNSQFNVPYGDRTGAMPDETLFIACAEHLSHIDLRTLDFELAIHDCTAGDLIYLDPPYPRNRDCYGEYGYGSFNCSDLIRLERVSQQAVEAGATVFVSLPEELISSVPALSTWSGIDHLLVHSVGASPAKRRRVKEVTLFSDPSGILAVV